MKNSVRTVLYDFLIILRGFWNLTSKRIKLNREVIVVRELLKSIWKFIWDKDTSEKLKNYATIVAFIIGAYWTYNNFIMERRNYPHGNIEFNVSHVPLSDRINLLRVAVEITNAGNSLLSSQKCIIRVQKVLPIVYQKNEPLVVKEIDDALRTPLGKEQRFSWPLLFEKEITFVPPLEIEPNEKDMRDFEFAIPSDIRVVRIYSYLRNERKVTQKQYVSWAASTYYDFGKVRKEGNE